MDMRDSSELSKFRQDIRSWVTAHWSETTNKKVYSGIDDPEQVNQWFRFLGQQGWLAYRWPQPYGGAGFDPPRQIVFADELRRCGAPVPRGFGISMVGPLIMQFGTEAQKQRFLLPIARHEEIWCQGYSEPNAGSDLASLQTSAVSDGEHYVVNGQKVWTSRAHLAQWIFVLVRTQTGQKNQEGISFLLVDMKTPGVSIRPIKQIDGCSGFFETFFENVRVPKTHLVGVENQGWSMAKALLAHERSSTSENVSLPGLLNSIKTLARHYTQGNQSVLSNASIRNRLASLEMDADCIRYTRYRLMTALMQGRTPGPESSILKLFQTDLCQMLYDLALEVMGPDAASWYEEQLHEEAYSIPMMVNISRAMSIFAGSNEIQRNIIAKRVLSLPT